MDSVVAVVPGHNPAKNEPVALVERPLVVEIGVHLVDDTSRNAVNASSCSIHGGYGTHHDRNQGIARSMDDGLAFTRCKDHCGAS